MLSTVSGTQAFNEWMFPCALQNLIYLILKTCITFLWRNPNYHQHVIPSTCLTKETYMEQPLWSFHHAEWVLWFMLRLTNKQLEPILRSIYSSPFQTDIPNLWLINTEVTNIFCLQHFSFLIVPDPETERKMAAAWPSPLFCHSSLLQKHSLYRTHWTPLQETSQLAPWWQMKWWKRRPQLQWSEHKGGLLPPNQEDLQGLPQQGTLRPTPHHFHYRRVSLNRGSASWSSPVIQKVATGHEKESIDIHNITRLYIRKQNFSVGILGPLMSTRGLFITLWLVATTQL